MTNEPFTSPCFKYGTNMGAHCWHRYFIPLDDVIQYQCCNCGLSITFETKLHPLKNGHGQFTGRATQ